MRCKEFEYLIIESSERDLTDEEQLKLKQHCSQCNDCVRFKEDLEEIRFSLKQSLSPPLTSDLDKKNKHFCMDVLNWKRLHSKQKPRPFRAPVPGYVWAAIILLTILTAILLFPELKMLNSDEPLSLRTIGLLTVILQNTVMLLFTPVIIRRYKAKSGFFNLDDLEHS